MSFTCPKCTSPDSLEIIRTLELPSDNCFDEITLQVVQCSMCAFRAIAIYEESRRGSLEEESWEHSGYQVADADLQNLVELIETCPEPGNRRCSCPSHRILGRVDDQGCWQGPGEMEIIRSFPMELS